MAKIVIVWNLIKSFFRNSFKTVFSYGYLNATKIFNLVASSKIRWKPS